MWVASSSSLPPPSRPSASVCTREAQVSPAPASRPTLQSGSLMDWRRDMLGKRGTYLFGRGRTTAHTQQAAAMAGFALL